MKRYIAILAFASLFLCSCNEKLDKVNTNPNNMEYGTFHPSSLLPNILFSGAEALERLTYNLSNEIIQYSVSSNTLDAYHRYQIPNGVPAGLWNNCARWAASADHMRELAEKDVSYCNFRAIALTMRAYYMQILVDSFGDAPFEEAFKGYYGTFKPKFDSTVDIYKQLIEDLDTALSLYDITGRPMSDAEAKKDYLYNGDLSKWRKFTNSLQLRILMRCSNCTEIDSKAKILEIFNNPATYPVFESNSDAAVYCYLGADGNINPYGSTDETSFANSRRAAEFIVEQMDATDDPRISLYFVQVGGAWRGAKSGVATRDDAGIGSAAKLNKKLIGDYASPFSFFNYDEVLFIWAEAAQRSIIPGGPALAKEYYNKAIEASIRHWSDLPGNDSPVTDKAIAQFLAKVAYNGTYEQLMVQKYVACFWYGFESWAEYRRTGYPDLPIANTTLNDQILPRRFEYPVNTASTNPENYAVALEHLQKDYKGGDDMKTPVWWSKYRIEHFN